jgi:hypothetical protein
MSVCFDDERQAFVNNELSAADQAAQPALGQQCAPRLSRFAACCRDERTEAAASSARTRRGCGLLAIEQPLLDCFSGASLWCFSLFILPPLKM